MSSFRRVLRRWKNKSIDDLNNENLSKINEFAKQFEKQEKYMGRLFIVNNKTFSIGLNRKNIGKRFLKKK